MSLRLRDYGTSLGGGGMLVLWGYLHLGGTRATKGTKGRKGRRIKGKGGL